MLGGGIDGDETDKQCIVRECIEETGYRVEVKEKICSAEFYCEHPTIGFFHPIQVYYIGEMIEKIQEPVELDHVFRWVNYEHIRGRMFLEMQNWALEQVKSYVEK